MSKKLFLNTAVLAAGIVFSLNVLAAETYAGATIGKAHWNIDTTGATNSNNSDTSLNLFGGYQFNQHCAVEAGYFSVGKVTASSPILAGEFKASGVDVAGVYTTSEMKGFSGFAKMGLAYVKGESTGFINQTTITTSKNSAQLEYGIGLVYKITDKIKLRGEYIRRNAKVAEVSGSTSTISNFAIGAQFTF